MCALVKRRPNMLRLRFLVSLVFIILIIFPLSTHAADSKPTEQSVRELLAATEARKLLDTVMVQVDSSMRAGMQQALKGQTITSDQQNIIDNMQHKMMLIFKEELNWESLEPIYIQVYRDSFTQKEVDGMLAFYKSPAGEAMIKKMPVVMQNTAVQTQKRMGPLFEKIQKMEEEAINQIKTKTTNN